MVSPWIPIDIDLSGPIDESIRFFEANSEWMRHDATSDGANMEGRYLHRNGRYMVPHRIKYGSVFGVFGVWPNCQKIALQEKL